ncbi:phosphoribosyltransferase family protein [Curtobacterium sp. AB451]|uniref:phosphoribosyltransferase family protein n=1 Tax=Curtobacterium sp. AB451 TaxID=3422306 RepID=UPI003D34942F
MAARCRGHARGSPGRGWSGRRRAEGAQRGGTGRGDGRHPHGRGRRRSAGRPVVVVDDVVTTGVTMAEAVRAVRAAGGRVVRCVAVASVDD